MDATATTGGTGKDWINAAVSKLVTMADDAKVASPSAVDAYKTYLYRRGNRSVKDIESCKAGQPIDLSELEKDIAATEATLWMCQQSELPAWDIEYKLKGLRAMRDQLVGRTWPSLEHIKAQAKAELENKKQESYNKTVLLAAAKAELAQQKTKNGPKCPDPVKKLGGKTVYSGKMAIPKILPLKPKPPVSADLVRLKIEQEWLMRVGMLSNCNVTILQYTVVSQPSLEVMLKCKVCSSTKDVANSAVSSTNVLTESIEQFCRDHRHEPQQAAQPKGRLFRDED